MAVFNSVFREEISMHLSVREAELSYEAYRHYRRTMILFDEYLCRINHADKEISESVIESWIREVSADISINTSGQHVHYIRQTLLILALTKYLIHQPLPKYMPLQYNSGTVPLFCSDHTLVSFLFFPFFFTPLP